MMPGVGLNCVPPLVASGRREAATALLARTLPVLQDNLGPQAPTVQRAQGWLESLRGGRDLPAPQTPADRLLS